MSALRRMPNLKMPGVQAKNLGLLKANQSDPVLLNVA